MPLSKEQIADDLHQEQMAAKDSVMLEWYHHWLNSLDPDESDEWDIYRALEGYDPPDTVNKRDRVAFGTW